ncbi:MAG TPA: UDP-N-acetylmuramoyl-tripeptide--D-alanyl-D-alanine ligase, partial [Chlamydiales bacterium]|nr:UDP-N-acetylmuramoyl-tripeptide--D-alanyl-D-alanine ligase [Chlamydiales bacterium]
EVEKSLEVEKHSSLLHEPYSGVYVNSKEVKAGALFFAIPGAKTDGHLFLQDAAMNGAKAAVVRKEYSGDSFGLTLIRVDDTLQALQKAAEKWRKQSLAKVIAITGTVGKTTTKDFLFQLLKTKYKVSASSGNKNSQIGLATVLLNETRGDEDFLVMEMGMTLPGHIKRLTEITPPHIALITEISLVHAENFESLEHIAEAKAEILSHPQTTLGIVNGDTQCVDLLMNNRHCKMQSYSFTNGNDFARLPAIDFPATHLYKNLLGAISCCRAVGMSEDEIGLGMRSLKLPQLRLQEIEKNGVFFINDCYNASPLAVNSALEVIRKKQVPGKKIAILGHMRELGKFSEESHRQVGQSALSSVDSLFCFGQECGPLVEVWKREKRDVNWCETFEELMTKFQKRVQKGDLVLVKGARTLYLERVVEQFCELE